MKSGEFVTQFDLKCHNSVIMSFGVLDRNVLYTDLLIGRRRRI